MFSLGLLFRNWVLLKAFTNLKPCSKFDFGDHLLLLEDSVTDVGLMLTWCNTENRKARKGYREM